MFVIQPSGAPVVILSLKTACRLSGLRRPKWRADNYENAGTNRCHFGLAYRYTRAFGPRRRRRTNYEPLPETKMAGHPSALKHLAEPAEKLAPAARKLYGAAFYNEQYHPLLPVDKMRLWPLADGEVISWLRTVARHSHARTRLASS